MAKRKNKKPRSKARKILFAIELIVVLLLIGGLFVYGQVNSRLTAISGGDDQTGQLNFKEEEVVVNTEVAQLEDLKGFKNIALFALDNRCTTGSAGGNNSDTIIVASINNDTKEIKLVSVYRDTLLDIGDDNYQKCNAAYAYGGVQQAVSMLNANLDLDISDYVTVDFRAMVAAIDLFGGLDIPLSYAEMVHMNNYCVETSEETGVGYVPLELPDPKPEDEDAILGEYHLNGVQATSYCRIRYTASLDMGRTERQRLVIKLLVDKAKKSSITELTKILDEVFPYVHTSLTKMEIVKLAMSAMSYNLGATSGFPMDFTMATLSSKGSVIIPTTLEYNVIKLHAFLFGDPNYSVSNAVREKSEQIITITGCDSQDSVVDESALEEMDNFLLEDPWVTYSYTDPNYVDPGTTVPVDPGIDPGYDPGLNPGGEEPIDPGYTDPEPPAEYPYDGGGIGGDGGGDYSGGGGDIGGDPGAVGGDGYDTSYTPIDIGGGDAVAE